MRRTGQVPAGFLLSPFGTMIPRGDVDVHWVEHHLIHWTQPLRTWLDAACPVYTDLGAGILWGVGACYENGMQCVRCIAQERLVHDAMVERRAEEAATGFDPVA